ncbi:MAG: hypothetical protein EP298_06460 [Gammaproteobacteria bacterium]|nr:MAG: hypothetical protein EP298_06460 [Gammaproteobacteria bacterium]UTW43290.1 hypothetical protein KFE69_03885 [bacterium SCSIO 12844]
MKAAKTIIKLLNITLLSLAPLTLFAQEDQSSNFFGKDAAEDGPITICSDSLHYDQGKNVLIYEGNVIIMQIKDIKLSCDPLNNHNQTKQISKASLWVPPSEKSYNTLQQKELNIAKSLCKQQGKCRYMSGQKLIVFLDEAGQAKQIQMLVNDQKSKLPVAKYYSLSTDKKNKQTPSYAYSKIMQFQPKKNLLTLEKNAFVQQKNNSFSGEKITYNTQTEVVNVPKQDFQRATMIISQEETNQVKGAK